MLDHWVSKSGVKASGIDNDGGNKVWVDVGSWSSILNISFTIIVTSLGWNTERGSSVTGSIGEFLKARGLVNTSKSLLIILSIKLHVEVMLGTHLDHHVINVFHSTGSLSHGLSGEVGVTSRSIPVGEKFWLERYGEVILLGTSHEKISGDPHVVTDLNSEAWSNLVLPLSWHDLGVGS